MKKKAVKKPASRSRAISIAKKKEPTRIISAGFPVVGIGGSAGSFSAMEKFFTHMPADSGMAFVVVLHLDPNHKGQISSVIQNYTPIPVLEAADGTMIERDHIYVIPPNKDIGIHNRKLLLMQPAKSRGQRMPIDYFLQSLAEDQMNRAVGIILSGMGSDGETGIRMIKERLGMAMVQDPVTAEYDSMPRSAMSTNLVDYLLPPEEMPIRLIQYMKHPALSEEPGLQALLDTKNNNAIHKVLMMLRSQTGHDFAHYKKSTITRRIDRRIAFHQLPDYARYVTFLRENPQELTILFNELLIGVTKFFRDAPAFDALTEQLLPLLRAKKDKEPIRVWVAGCSTGEEAYSIAILISEYLETLQKKSLPKVQIFATDLDAEAIEHARQGVYLGNITADVSPLRLEKYFIKQNDGYTVKKDLREMVIFAQHNIIKDAPFTRLDLLSCRNLLIYLNIELQKKLIPIFHYSLAARGILFLGPAETIGGFSDMFQHVEPKWKLFERKGGITLPNRIVDFPFNISYAAVHSLKVEHEKGGKKNTLFDTFNRLLLDNYTPTSLLVNDRGDILYINGKTKNYLELGTGEVTMNVYRMAREELKYALSNAIHQARNKKTEISIRDIRLKDGKNLNKVSLRVNALDHFSLPGLVLVVFEEGGPVLGHFKKGVFKKDGNVAVDELEKELLFTKQQLHSTIEQMETSVEELKSTNEELQSTNEELQSTNEESLTTKEEMQSLNEELMTINMQYQSKAEELTQVNNDMKNLLDNTEIGTIFVDNNLDILRFTPQVSKLFRLIQTDVGRSITHIVNNLQRNDLEKDIREVIDYLKIKEIEVNARDEEWYSLRIMPYRTIDNFISGAVLTFQRITPLKKLEEKLRLIQRATLLMVNAIREPAVLLDERTMLLAANDAFIQLFKISENGISRTNFRDLFETPGKNSAIEKLLKEARQGPVSVEIQHEFPGAKTATTTHMIARKVEDEEARGKAVILVTLEFE
jgi:two-component system, chemotaxis family, CheB/CheR fusion protein